MSRSDWNEFTDEYPQSIKYERGDHEDFLEEDMTDEEWFYFRQRVLKKTLDSCRDETLSPNYPQSIELSNDGHMSKEQWWEFSELFWDAISEVVVEY